MSERRKQRKKPQNQDKNDVADGHENEAKSLRKNLEGRIITVLSYKKSQFFMGLLYWRQADTGTRSFSRTQ